MKLSNIISELELTRLAELDAPMLGAPPAAGTPAPTAMPQQDPQAAAKAQAMAAKQMLDRKKQIQDAIKQKQQELTDLQKQLAEIK